MTGLNDALSELDPESLSATACKCIWLAVIERAFLDAEWTPSPGLNDRRIYQAGYNARCQALYWLRGKTDGFRAICHAANLEPTYVRRKAQERFGELVGELQPPITLKQANALAQSV